MGKSILDLNILMYFGVEYFCNFVVRGDGSDVAVR